MSIKNENYVLPIYDRFKDVLFTKGKGCYLFDKKNNKYLDFASGISVNSLGHCNAKINKVAKEQIDKLWHISGAFWNENIIKAAKLISDNTFAHQVYFMNSGAEANETAIKIARRYFYSKKQDHKNDIICFDKSFHGRTLACLAAQNRYTEGFDPLPKGFKHALFNDIKSVKSLIDKNTAAILIEPIQAEGGVRIADKEFLKELRKICDKEDILLIFDEVQCGMGRTGTLYSYMQYGVIPDILTSAKGIGNGFPVSAILFNEKTSSCAKFGMHGSTYSGNPLACAIVNAVFTEIKKESFLKKVKENGAYLISNLKQIQKKYKNIIEEIKGLGLMIGIKLNSNYFNEDLRDELRKNKMLCMTAADNMIRFLPPLIVTKKEIDIATEKLELSLQNLKQNHCEKH